MPPVYDAAFVEHLLASYLQLTSKRLVPAYVAAQDAARWLYEEAEFAVLAHDTAADPRFVYANRFAQRCFELECCEIVGMPSRLSAEPAAREERAAALSAVATQGYATNYRGVRIAKSGRRFWIEHGTLWNVLAPDGLSIGQAASFATTTPA
jgi:hypothetical protein